MRTILLSLALAAASGFFVFYDLGASSIHNTDEAGHSIVAQEILENGEWISLTFLGEPYFKKPPLKFWLSAMTYEIAGVNEFTVRLWSAIFAVGTVLALFWLGRLLYGDRAAFLGALVLLTTHQFLYNHCARTGELDSALLFFWTTAVLLFLLAVDRSSEKLLVLAFVAVGLVGMVKHAGFVPQVLLILALQLALGGSWRRFSPATWFKAAAALLAVVLPWHLVQGYRFGAAFFDEYILGEVVARAAGEVPVSHPTELGGWFYLVVLKDGFFPWSLLLPFTLALPFFRDGRRERGPDLALITWMVVALAIATASEAKNFWYALPALPPAALLLGRFVDTYIAGAKHAWIGLCVAVASIAALLSTSTAATHNPFAVRARHEMIEVDLLGRIGGAHGTSFVLAAAAVGLVALLGRRRPVGRWMTVAILTSLAVVQVVSPLKFTASRNVVDLIVSKALEERQPDDGFAISLPNKIRRPIRHQFYFRQLGPDAEIVGRGQLLAWRNALRKPRLLVTTAEQARHLEAQARRYGKKRTRILHREPPFALVRLDKYPPRIRKALDAANDPSGASTPSDPERSP